MHFAQNHKMILHSHRRVRASEAREHIMQVAAPLFAKNGYRGVSMRELAQAVGVTQAALYYHFKDKQELYLGVVDMVLKDVVVHWQEAQQDCQGDPVARLHAVVSCIIGRLSEDADECLLLQRLLLENNEEHNRVLAQGAFTHMFEGLMDLAQALEIGPESRLWVLSLVSLCFLPFEGRNLIANIPGMGSGTLEPETLINHVVGLLLPCRYKNRFVVHSNEEQEEPSCAS